MFMWPTKYVWKAFIALSKEKIIGPRTEYSENNTLWIFFVLYELFPPKKKPQNKKTTQPRKKRKGKKACNAK